MILKVVLKPEQYDQQPNDLKFSPECEELIKRFAPYQDWVVSDGFLWLELDRLEEPFYL